MKANESSDIINAANDAISRLSKGLSTISPSSEADRARAALSIPQGKVKPRELFGHRLDAQQIPGPPPGWKELAAATEEWQGIREHELSIERSQLENDRLRQQNEQQRDNFRWQKRLRIISVCVLIALVCLVAVAEWRGWDLADAAIAAAGVQLFNTVLINLRGQNGSS